MAHTFAALAPIFVVIALGVWIRRWLKADEGFWRLVEKLTYFVMFPSLLVHRLATTPLPESNLAAAMGAIRFNTYAGLAGAVALYGQEGLAVFALLLAVNIPLVNVLSALLLGRNAAAGAASPHMLALAVATNPLVIACALGIAINLSGLALPAFAERTLAILGNAALGIGLVSVGAALRLESLVADRRGIALATLIKMFAMPGLAALFCHLLGVGGVERAVVVLFAALPSSPAAYVLARQMGGNAPMMAGIITLSTPAAMVVLPLALSIFG